MRQYYVWRMYRSDVIDLPMDFLEVVMEDMAENFRIKMRRWYMYSTKICGVSVEQQYDIDYDLHKWIFEETPKPFQWKMRYTFLTVTPFGIRYPGRV